MHMQAIEDCKEHSTTSKTLIENVGTVVKNAINENIQTNEKEKEIGRGIIVYGIMEDNIKNYD